MVEEKYNELVKRIEKNELITKGRIDSHTKMIVYLYEKQKTDNITNGLLDTMIEYAGIIIIWLLCGNIGVYTYMVVSIAIKLYRYFKQKNKIKKMEEEEFKIWE